MFGEYLDAHDMKKLLTKPYAPCPPRADRAAWDGLSQAVRAELLAWGGEARAGYPPLMATQFLAFSRTGDRQVFEKPYFARRNLLLGAALAECASDSGAYLDAVIDGLWCVLEESTWVISAHNGSDHAGPRPMKDKPLPDVTNPYVDLFAAQTAALLADVLYLLEDKLDAVTPLIARRVRVEIERRVLTPFMTHDDFWWMGVIRKDVNNWTPWILSNVMETALILERDAARRAEIVERALRMLDCFLAILPEDGGCDEGVGYFNMAGLSLFDCLEQARMASDGALDFYGEPLIRAVCAYPARMHVAGDLFLNFADCDAKPILDGDRIYLYGVRTDNARAAALGASLHARRMLAPENLRPRDVPQMSRILFALFAGALELPEAEHPPFEAMEHLQVYIWRTKRLTVSLKGGHNAEGHNHNDVGSFVVYVDGEPCVVDMGNCVYTAKTFGPERYTLDNTRSMNHNLPRIGGYEQTAGRTRAARAVHADARGARMQLENAYPEEAGILSFAREITVEEKTLTLCDSIKLSRAREVEWVFMLRLRPELAPGIARLGPMTLAFDPALACEATEYPVTDARMARNFPGSLWRLTLTEKDATAHRQRMRLTRSDA